MSAKAHSVLRKLGERGVHAVRGTLFSAVDPVMGVPPKGAMNSEVLMLKQASPLDAAERAAVVEAVRGEVFKVAANVLAEADITVAMSVATFCFEPASGIAIDVELLGLTDYVARVLLA